MAEISIIIPCRNDRETLRGAVAAVSDVVTHSTMSVETLIVDDESTDGTRELAQQLVREFPVLHIRVLTRKSVGPYGFGALLRYGMAYAQGRFCALVSADGHDPVSILPQFVARLRAGASLTQCTRFERPEDRAEVPTKFRLYQRIYRFFVRHLLGFDVTDTTYGFRAFDRVFVQALGVSSMGFNICPEMTFKVTMAGGKVEYIAGRMKSPDIRRSSKFLLAREIWGYGLVVLRAVLHRYLGIRWF